MVYTSFWMERNNQLWEKLLHNLKLYWLERPSEHLITNVIPYLKMSPPNNVWIIEKKKRYRIGIHKIQALALDMPLILDKSLNLSAISLNLSFSNIFKTLKLKYAKRINQLLWEIFLLEDGGSNPTATHSLAPCHGPLSLPYGPFSLYY